MALDILRRAEAGRAAVAQGEAEQGINWEETPQRATPGPDTIARE